LSLEALNWKTSLQKQEMWLWCESTDKMFTQKSREIQCAEVPQCHCWNQGVFETLIWGAIVPQSPHIFLQISLVPVKDPLNKGKRWRSTAA